jgi:hypothetical protein
MLSGMKYSHLCKYTNGSDQPRTPRTTRSDYVAGRRDQVLAQSARRRGQVAVDKVCVARGVDVAEEFIEGPQVQEMPAWVALARALSVQPAPVLRKRPVLRAAADQAGEVVYIGSAGLAALEGARTNAVVRAQAEEAPQYPY